MMCVSKHLHDTLINCEQTLITAVNNDNECNLNVKCKHLSKTVLRFYSQSSLDLDLFDFIQLDGIHSRLQPPLSPSLSRSLSLLVVNQLWVITFQVSPAFQ